jgi:hypothetical protein
VRFEGKEAAPMKPPSIISATVLFLLLGAPAIAYAQQEQQGDDQKHEQQGEKQGKPGKQAKPEQPRGAQQAKEPLTKPSETDGPELNSSGS